MLGEIPAKFGMTENLTLLYGIIFGLGLLIVQFTIVATGQEITKSLVGYKAYTINQNLNNRCGDTIYHIPTYGCWSRLKDITILLCSHGVIILIGLMSMFYIAFSSETNLLAQTFHTFGFSLDTLSYTSKISSPLMALSISVVLLMLLNFVFMPRIAKQNHSETLTSDIINRLRTTDWGELPWAKHVLEFEDLYMIRMDQRTFKKVVEISRQSPWNLGELRNLLVKACFKRDKFLQITQLINPKTTDFSKENDALLQMYVSSLILSRQSNSQIFSKFETLETQDYPSSSLYWMTKGLVDHYYKRWDDAKAASLKFQAIMQEQGTEPEDVDKVIFKALHEGNPLPDFS